MTIPIAVQLYTVREALAGDFRGVMERIAEIGYIGVEPIFSLPGTSLEAAATLFEELGLEVPSAHVPLPLGDDRGPVLNFMSLFGSGCIVSGKGPESFQTVVAIKRTCGLFNEAHAIAAEHGLQFAIHNHWWEFEQVDGRYVYHVMLDYLDPAVGFELDTYWVQAAGLDPATVVKELGPRAPLLHLKDGPAKRDVPQVAVGQGTMDIPAIVQASGETAEWLIVELDHCATDMLEAVEASYRYLVREGLAHGNQG